MPPDCPPDVLVGMWVLRDAARGARVKELAAALVTALAKRS